MYIWLTYRLTDRTHLLIFWILYPYPPFSLSPSLFSHNVPVNKSLFVRRSPILQSPPVTHFYTFIKLYLTLVFLSNYKVMSLSHPLLYDINSPFHKLLVLRYLKNFSNLHFHSPRVPIIELIHWGFIFHHNWIIKPSLIVFHFVFWIENCRI